MCARTQTHLDELETPSHHVRPSSPLSLSPVDVHTVLLSIRPYAPSLLTVTYVTVTQFSVDTSGYYTTPTTPHGRTSGSSKKASYPGWPLTRAILHCRQRPARKGRTIGHSRRYAYGSPLAGSGMPTAPTATELTASARAAAPEHLVIYAIAPHDVALGERFVGINTEAVIIVVVFNTDGTAATDDLW